MSKSNNARRETWLVTAAGHDRQKEDKDNGNNDEPKPHRPDRPAPKPVKEPGGPEPEVDDPKRRMPVRTRYSGKP